MVSILKSLKGKNKRTFISYLHLNNNKEKNYLSHKILNPILAISLLYFYVKTWCEAGKLWLMGQIQPVPVFKNKVLLEDNHIHSFTYHLWVLLQRGKVE